MKKIAFHTLGCKLNFSETATLSRFFIAEGYETISFNKKADVYLINTCSVTATADKKCKQAIRKAIRLNPSAKIIVTGCFAQLKPKEIVNIPGVSLVVGAQEKLNLPLYLKHIDTKEAPKIYSCESDKVSNFFPAYSLHERVRSFLKVQDGCDYICTYCTIPQARGKSRSGKIVDLINEAEEIAKSGLKEIILTGVNIGDFGKESTEDFFALIQALDKVDGIERIRISSIEPNLLTEEIINYIATSKKIMPHFHIPLQSGSDNVLRDMKRRYDTNLFREKITYINKKIPHAGIGIDVIVGFPTESQKLFEETVNFINNLDIMNLHVFTYSERANTLAASMKETVPIDIRHKRSKYLHLLSAKKQRFFNEQFLFTKQNVLIEHKDKEGYLLGFTENYIRIKLPYRANLKNKIISVKLTKLLEDGSMQAVYLD